MKRALPCLLVFLIALIVVLFGATAIMAQTQKEPDTPLAFQPGYKSATPLGLSPFKLDTSLSVSRTEQFIGRPDVSLQSNPQATGGPDDFGYTWDDTVALQWIDTGGGSNTGINDNTAHAGPFDIGFGFKFYERTYSQLYISRYGYISFTPEYLDRSQSFIPSLAKPDGVIAPHWVPGYRVAGYVHYLRGGSAPNRWIAVEWNRLISECCGDQPEEYTFQAILRENGDIIFQYDTMIADTYWYCQSSGIEDSPGIDGLAITDYCRQIPPNHAVRIRRPAASARVKVFPLFQGSMTAAGKTTVFSQPVTNAGDLGADTFDLITSSTWPATFYAADGVIPLRDTDGDGVIDVGSLALGATANFVAKVQAPATARMGDFNEIRVTIRSSRNTAKSKTVVFQASIPSNFAQVYRDDGDGAISLFLASPQRQTVKKVTDISYPGFGSAITETPNGYLVSVWSKNRCLDVECYIGVQDLEYALLDKMGNVRRAIDNLTDNSGALLNTYDYTAAVAAAPDGRIGVVWDHYLYDRNTSQHNDNIFFAILSSSGDLEYGPVNITNYGSWGDWSSLNLPLFYFLQIVATDDNRFVLAWLQEHRESAGWVDNIWYEIRNTSGQVIKSKARITNDTPGDQDGYFYPTLARIAGNRFLLAMQRQGDIYYTVFNSNGTVSRQTARLTSDGANWGSYPDATQLPSGNVAIAWTGDPPRDRGRDGWSARYYSNETLTEPAALVRTDSEINFNWGLGSPNAAINPDYFSVRWIGTIVVEQGTYEFWMGSDDGSRLWIDNQLVLDHWNDCCTHWNVIVSLSRGTHQIKMEMHEHDGAAWADLFWQPASNGPLIRYALLNSSLALKTSRALTNPAALTGDGYVSVTADRSDRAILTWMDRSYYARRNLYYASIDADGSVPTPPMIFQTSQAREPYIVTNFYGYGNTSYSFRSGNAFLPGIFRTRSVSDNYEPNDTIAQAWGPLESGAEYRSYIFSVSDKSDYYYFDVPYPHPVEIWLSGIPSGANYHLYLYDARPNLIADSANPGNADEHILTGTLPAGRYYIRVYQASGFSSTQPYSLRVVYR